MRSTDLEYFKNLLSDRKVQIKKNITDSVVEIMSLETDYKDEMDQASASTDRMIERAINNQQSKELDEIESNLLKISKNEYGICEMCEEEIGIQRLKIIPHAKYCIDCKEILEKQYK